MADKKVKATAVEVVPVNEYATFYVHESADPLSGNYGVGVHGYVCTDTEAKRGYGLKKIIPTKEGYTEKTSQALRIIDSVIDIRLPLYSEQDRATVTNCLVAGCNAALGLVLQMDEEKRPKIVRVILPRKNLVGFLTKGYEKCVADGYLDSKGNPIPFKDGLDAYLRNVGALEKLGVDVAVLYGPMDGAMGMPEARANANDAVVACLKHKEGEAEPSCHVSPPEGYWNHDHGRHPLLTKSRMVFAMSNGQAVKTDRLFLMDFEKSSKKKEQTHKIEIEVGQLLPSASYAVVKVNDVDPIIWKIAEEHSKYLDVKYERLGVLFLDAVFKPGAHSVMSKVGADYLYSKTVVTDLIDSRETMYSHELNPARQAYRAWNTYLDMDALMQEFLKAMNSTVRPPEEGQCIQFQDARGSWAATNITSRFIETTEEKKGKVVYKASKEIDTPNTAILVKGFYLDEEDAIKEASVNLSIGIDMPKRNAISAMAGEQTRAYLLLRQDTAFTVRHFVVVTNGDEYGIWTAPFANRTFVKK